MASATVQMAGYSIRGTYEGGAYIDLHFGNSPDAFDAINVWDHATDKPTIPNTSAAVRHELIEWRKAAGDSLAHDLREYAISMRGF